MLFEFHRLRFVMEAREEIFLPPGKAGNVLRGCLGLMFAPAAYERLFAPIRREEGPSGLADSPRPFVFRASHLDGLRARPGERFFFGVNLFEASGESAALFAGAFEKLGKEGIGPGRGKALLAEWTQSRESIDLTACGPPVNRLTVQFVTPTEIKGTVEPEFGVLMARVRDRISTLRGLYGSGPLDIDFRGFGERAWQVRMATCDLHHVDAERRSSRTGQSHPIGGFTGVATYDGALSEFIPLLQCAVHAGVGRQTVWGKGEIALES